MKGLRRALRRTIGAWLLRRLLAWAAWGLLLLVAARLGARLMGGSPWLAFGVPLAWASLLPVFLFWPLPEGRLRARLRALDDEMAFEAFLEAPPGPARELLRRLAEEKAAALDLKRAPREPLFRGLRGLLASALLVFVLGEVLSFRATGHGLVLGEETPKAEGKGRRLEEEGFPGAVPEDPAARRAAREGALDRLERAEAARQAGAPGGPGRTGAASRGTATAQGTGEQGARDLGAGTTNTASAGSKAPGQASPQGGNPQPGQAQGAQAARPGAEGTNEKGGARPGGPPPAQAGSGYEHTGNTRVPSPLLDYRSRLETRYAERTGHNPAATGGMNLGELRDFQRRYFDSFSLRVDVAPAEDPYLAQLKRRWAETRP